MLSRPSRMRAVQLARARIRRRETWLIAAGLIGVATLAIGVAALTLGLPGEQVVAAEASAVDTDADAVPDAFESAFFGQRPFDASRSALPDRWIRDHGLDVGDPLLASREAPYPEPPQSPPAYGSEGLPLSMRMTLGEVYAYGRPTEWDEARDGTWDSGLDPNGWTAADPTVPYAWSIHHGIDPFDLSALDRPSTIQGVTWSPRQAYLRGLHPFSTDGDGDGLADERELELGLDPRAFSTTGTGIADGWSFAWGFDPFDAALAYVDSDLDGLTNLEEFEASLAITRDTLRGQGLDPRNARSGGAPIPDGWLIRHGFNPLDPTSWDIVTQTETGDDGVTLTLRVVDEYHVNRPPGWNEAINGPWWGGTDPRVADTDGDGLGDAREILGWTITIDEKPRLVRSDPTLRDTDGDGLSDGEERHGLTDAISFPPTDPSAPDSDFDGLSDGEELGLVKWNGIDLPRVDPTRRDTDGDGLADGEEAAYWLARSHSYSDATRPYEWGPPDRPSFADVFARDGTSPEAARARFLPTGDLDGDGLANLIDPDSDQDGLFDGWEVRPQLYRDSPYASATPRRASDPANPDTDLDELPDGWEVSMGIVDAVLGTWNLDPSLWSSFHDDTSDAERDLDGDSILWHRYVSTPTGRQVQPVEFKATNLVEFLAGSDPNRRSSSPDGLSDGWKIFWGSEYPGLSAADRGEVYPGAPGTLSIRPERPLPRIGSDDSVIIGTYGYVRYQSTEKTGLLAGESAAAEEFVDAAGASQSVRRITGTITFDYRAAAANLTNPFVDDTDGDGMPDIWESLWGRLGPLGKRVSPITPDGDADADGDGLTNREEWAAGSDPYLTDSDFGGATDDVERLLSLSPVDPRDDREALASGADTDGDGLRDLFELLGGADRRTFTDPSDPDSDHDGLLDGARLSTVLGRTLHSTSTADNELVAGLAARGLLVVRGPGSVLDVPGEKEFGSDPTRFSTTGEGVPEGWLVKHGLPPTEASGLFADYSNGRPTWWDETKMGVWWWGLAPGATPSRDRDADGLDDLNGEDPIPSANRANTLPEGDPREPGVAPLDVLKRAQAYAGPVTPATSGARAMTSIVLEPPPATIPGDGTFHLNGSVTAAGRPAPNATVVISIWDRSLVVGVAVTNATGDFSAPITLTSSIPAPAGSEGIVVFGTASGLGVHTNDATRLAAVPTDAAHPLFAWTYNVSEYGSDRQATTYPVGGVARRGHLGSSSASTPVEIEVPTTIQVTAPASVKRDAQVALELRIVDGLGRPVANAPVTLEPGARRFVTGPEGNVTAQLWAPTSETHLAGNVSFAGSGSLLGTHRNFSVRILQPTVLDILPPPAAVAPGSPFAIVGRLSSNGQSVPDARVELLLATRVATVTNATGALRHVTTLPVDTPPGRFLMVARFTGNDTLEPTSTEVPILVGGTSRWHAPTLIVRLENDIVATARLLDHGGAPVVGAAVRASSASGITRLATTDAAGNVTFKFPAGTAPPGEHSFDLRTVGEEPTRGFIRIVVTSTTRVEVTVDDIVRGHEAVARGSLQDALGQPVHGQPVLVRAGSVERHAITRADGSFEARWPAALHDAGAITLQAIHHESPDGIYARSNSTEIAKRVHDGAKIRFASHDVALTRPRLDAVVTTLLDEPLHDVRVVFEFPWARSEVRTTSEGRAHLPLDIPSVTALGRFAADILIESEGRVVPSSFTPHFTLRDAGVLRVAIPPGANQGATVEATVDAVDSRGRILPDVRLLSFLDDIPLSSTLDRDVLAFRVPPGASIGQHRITLRLVSDVLDAPDIERTFTVRAPTQIRLLESGAASPGMTTSMRVQLTSGTSPIADASLLIIGAGAVPIRVKTAQDGSAVIPISTEAFASNRALIVFESEGQHGASTLPVSLTTASAPLPASSAAGGWLTALAVLTLLLVSVFMWRRRRSGAAVILAGTARRLRRDAADLRALYEAYVSLLDLAGISEDDAETLTFTDLLSRFTDADEDARVVTDAFDAAVYAPDSVPAGLIERAAGSLERLAKKVGQAPEVAP